MNIAMPTVLAALVTLARGACPSADIIDGVPLDEGDNPLAITIGGSIDDLEDVESASGDFTWAALGRVYDEQGAISCEIAAWSGDEAFIVPVTAAFNALTAILTAIAADPSLSGAVVWVKSAPNVRLVRTRDSRGLRVILQFTIEYQAR